jgi:hypothetical protein
MRIDSNSIQIPFDAINRIDLNNPYFVHSPKYQGGELIKDVYSISSGSLPVGLSGISIDKNREVVNISSSAKLLGNEYLSGINVNTYEQFIDSINGVGVIELDKNKVFEQGIFHKLDTTNNVDMGTLYNLDKNWTEVLSYLEVAKLNDRFTIGEYDKKHNQGIAYIGNQKEKNRLIIYRKYLDLTTTKDKKGISNKLFLASLQNPYQFLEQTRQILRVESNHTTFKSIRLRLGIKTNSINDVLTNGVNPNPIMLDKITQPHRENQLLMVFNEYNPENYSLDEIIKLEGIKNLIRNANYCEKTLKQFVKRYTTESMFRWFWYGGKKSITPFRPLINELRVKDANKDPQVNKVIELIRNTILNDKVA